jgi:hypothetical protein
MTQLGVGGVISTSGYISSYGNFTGAGAANSTDFLISTNDGGLATMGTYGIGTLALLTGTTWVFTAQYQTMTSTARQNYSGTVGQKVLTGTLDTIKLTASNGQTWTSGSINLLFG